MDCSHGLGMATDLTSTFLLPIFKADAIWGVGLDFVKALHRLLHRMKNDKTFSDVLVGLERGCPPLPPKPYIGK
jgi:hypothetical protein